MADDERGRVPRQRRMRVAVEMHEVGLEVGCDVEQPLAGSLDVAPRIGHPLERAGLGVRAGDAGGTKLRSLRLVERRAHRGKRYLDATVRERVRELERVRPHAADRVGRHQNPHRRAP